METAKAGGGSVTWVPEDEFHAIVKTIKKKGEYKASDDGAYAYSKVIVKIKNARNHKKGKSEKDKEFVPVRPNITIQEGSVGKGMNGLKKLRIALQGGGYSLWVPEDNTKTKSKTVSGNGTFEAKNDGVFGYDEFTVSIETTEHDGKEYAIDVDPDTGEITETPIPSYITIITPPDVTVFQDGSNIIIDGIEVMAYFEDDTEWGIVPFEELEIDPTTADISQTSPKSEATSDLDTKWNQPIQMYSYAICVSKSGNATVTTTWYPAAGCVMGIGEFQISTDTWAETLQSKFVFATSDQSKRNQPVGYCREHFVNESAGIDRTEIDEIIGGNTYINDGKTVVYCATGSTGGWHVESLEPVVPDYTTGDSMGTGKEAWTMIYGNVIHESSQEITVIWNRPEDGEELTDTYFIEVHDRH